MVSVEDLLKCCSGLAVIPPMGLSNDIQLDYLPSDDKYVLPQVRVCFLKLLLPTVHKSKEAFFRAFATALEYGGGYGVA